MADVDTAGDRRFERHNGGVAQMLCPILVGRDGELAALDDGLSAVRRGAGGRMVFVTGEAGIGKSRLAREVGQRARDGGMRAVVGRAVPSGAGLPYRPLTEALLQTLRERPWPAGRRAR